MGVYYIAYDLDRGVSLAHYQVKGAKWHIRRWQNKDGSLTPAGRIHYGYGAPRAKATQQGLDYKASKKIAKNLTKAINKDLRERSWHDVSSDAERYRNQREVWREINEKLSDTDEAKAANKAWDDREKYWERHKGETFTLKPGYSKHDEEVNKTQEAYHKKVLEIQDAFKDKMLSAKLKDLKQEDTAEARQVLDAILKDNSKLSVYSQLKNSREAKAALKELSKPKWEPLTAENSKRKFSDSDKTTMKAHARDNDSWDLDFLESIQNSKILHDGNTKAMLREYEQYLDDPYDYMQNRGHKLPEP